MFWFPKYRLRALMALTLLFCVAFGSAAGYHHRAQRQRHIVEFLRSRGGSVRYDFNFDSEGQLQPERPRPEFVARWLGADYCGDVVQVEFDGRFSPGAIVDDDVLRQVGRFRYLTRLNLTFTEVVVTDWTPLKNLTKLQILLLSDTPIDDKGLESIAELKCLEQLLLDGTRITDMGLVNLSKLQNLFVLSLSNTEVSDAGLQHCQMLTKLDFILVYDTRVTPDGKTAMKRHLPRCEFQ